MKIPAALVKLEGEQEEGQWVSSGFPPFSFEAQLIFSQDTPLIYFRDSDYLHTVSLL